VLHKQCPSQRDPAINFIQCQARVTNLHDHRVSNYISPQKIAHCRYLTWLGIAAKDSQNPNMQRTVYIHLVNTETIAFGVSSVPILHQIKSTQRPASANILKRDFRTSPYTHILQNIQ
jgi:hypothetical protein